MEAISLKKVTAIVVICILGALIANANANEAKVITESTAAVAEKLSDKTANFQALVKKFDQDNNGLLSKAELTVANNDKLIKAFADIDSDADLNVSEAEFAQYFAKTGN